MTTADFDRGRIRLARELMGWNQTRLAAAVDISAAALSQFESGATRPRPKTLERMADELGVPTDFFFQPLVESHEGFFRSLRRTPVAERRRVVRDAADRAAVLVDDHDRPVGPLGIALKQCLNHAV